MTGHRSSAGSTSTCPGCGLTAAEPAGPVPEDHVASAACWAVYGEVLARSYADSGFRAVHQVVVDAYAAQHAGGTSRRAVQKVALCLMTLCLVVEDGVDPADGPALHKRMVASRPDFSWLAPPSHEGLTTAADVLTARDADEHRRLVRRWGEHVWGAWRSHHATVRAWNARALAATTTRSSTGST